MKTITIYTPNGKIPVITEDDLTPFIFHPLKTEDELSSRLGFTPNVEGELVSTLMGNISIRLAQQKKIVNKYELNKLLDSSEILFEKDTGNPYNKKEKDEAKLRCTEELLSKTPPSDNPKLTDIIITPSGLVIVGAAPKLAEECLSLLRQSIGSLPVIPLRCNMEPSARMTDMVIGGLNETITLSDKVVLTTPEERVITITKGSTLESEALDLIEQGSFVTSLALEYDSVIKFLLKEDMTLTGVKFDKVITSELDKDDEVGSFLLQSSEVIECIDAVIGEFDGITDNS